MLLPGNGGTFECFFTFLWAFLHSMHVVKDKYSVLWEAGSGETDGMAVRLEYEETERRASLLLYAGGCSVISGLAGSAVRDFVGKSENPPIRFCDLGGT
jgi:hypothetical protein